MRTQSVRAAIYTALYMPVVLFLATIGTAIAVVAGGLGVTTGAVTLGTVVTFVGYSVQFFEPVREVARVLGEFQAAQSAAERLDQLLQEQPTVVDRPTVTATYGDIVHPNLSVFPPVRGEIQFLDVSFSYTRGQPVIEKLSLTIPDGQSVALVGETGAGKSTIVNLVGRFYEPTDGQLLIDGVDYRERSISWIQTNLGYVLQTPHLFRGTIRENIRYGRLDATDREVEEAAAIVAADDLIRALPGGFEYEVGESGSGLSVGEKQLVSFARAVLADPAIFVLDEATSSVDTDTEIRIQRAITSLVHGRTSIMIAHRLSTIRHADRILVLEHGRVIEDETHDELLSAGGAYTRLHAEHRNVDPGR
jgi:ATP-binding cassette subfamily B protein